MRRNCDPESPLAAGHVPMRIILHTNKRWESAVESISVAGPQKKWPEHGDCALKRLLRG